MVKTVDEIYQEMAAAYAGATGMEAGASPELAARFYAVAAQVQALLVQAEWVKRQCFPQTAEGAQLDQHAQLRGLERRAATAAEGVVRFSVDAPAEADRPIPAGTVCMTAGQVRFETAAEGVIRAGTAWADVRARAVEPGAAGNVAAGTILSMAVAPVGVARCTNPAAFTGGGDREGDGDLRRRVLETFRRLPNGANAAFYHQGAMSFEEVAAAAVLPRSRGIGTVDVVAATHGGLPSADLLARLTEYFQARREIAVDVAVRAPVEKPVDVAVRVWAEQGRKAGEVARAVEAALRAWFCGERLGRDVLRAQLGALVYGVPGVANYEISAPAADVAAAADELPVLENLTVEGMV